MSKFFDLTTHIFDPIHAHWERPSTQKAVNSTLVITFLMGLAGIELNRWGVFPDIVAGKIPTSHFYAVNLAFTLVLVVEVLDLVFILPCSVSKTVSKQFEILALIFLRNAFKELVHFSEPIDLAGQMATVLRILSDGAGALLIFLGLGVYHQVLRKKAELTNSMDIYGFVATKKAISLVLLASFAVLGVESLCLLVWGDSNSQFFEMFYTLLIFTDILMVLISQRYLPAFNVIFRNSGYALSTLLLRLALTAPQYWDAALAITSVVLAVTLTMANNYFVDVVAGDRAA